MPIACWLVMYNKYLCTDHIVTPKSLPIVLEIRQEIGLYLLNTKLMFLWPQWMFSRQSFVKSVHVQTLVRGWLAFLVFNRTFHQTLFTLIGPHSCTIVNSSFFQLQQEPFTPQQHQHHSVQCHCVSACHWPSLTTVTLDHSLNSSTKIYYAIHIRSKHSRLLMPNKIEDTTFSQFPFLS